jgi:uncharacterized protein YndB with AHSA1/START domain
MGSTSQESDLGFSAERRVPQPVARVWEKCTTKDGLESWWSPEDLRTTVRNIEVRPGGSLVLAVRYAPAMLGPGREEAFRAAGVPISFGLRGRFREVETHRRIVLELTLTLDRAGSGIDSVVSIEMETEAEGTRVRLEVSGKSNPHWENLGRANVSGQLDRLVRSLGEPPP